MDTKLVYFDSDRTEIRSQDVLVLESVAKALTADPNAVLELQGFADARGSERYNRELARERMEAVMRYLVQHHGIELRQVRAITMGKVALPAGEKPSQEALASARRVDIRLLAPWSSWEDTLGQVESTPEAQGSATISSVPAGVTPRGGMPEFLKTITPSDLGGK